MQTQAPTPLLHDAHNHLQDERLRPCAREVFEVIEREHIARMVVNGSSEEDWPAVLELARQHDYVIPSFGYHPWYVRKRSARWQPVLLEFLEAYPSAVGEVGLDRWVRGHDLDDQTEVFRWQLGVAAERELPVSIHCLQAWGRLEEVLSRERRPACGFLLHSFGGPVEMVDRLAELGAYFSLPGYFAHERKSRQRDAFRRIPKERLLLETDAPDQLLPEERVLYPLVEPGSGMALNHPGNLRAVYQFAAELFNEPVDRLASQVAENFERLFGGLLMKSKPSER